MPAVRTATTMLGVRVSRPLLGAVLGAFCRPRSRLFETPSRGRSAIGLPEMDNVIFILSAIEQGEPARRRAAAAAGLRGAAPAGGPKLAREKPGQTLQATALVHEAYLRLVDVDKATALEQPRSFLRRRRGGHAPHPHGEAREEQPARGGTRHRCRSFVDDLI